MEIAVNQIELNTNEAGEKTVIKGETIDTDTMVRELRDSQSETSYKVTSKLTPYDSSRQSHKEQIAHPIRIKHEPEELPDTIITDAEEKVREKAAEGTSAMKVETIDAKRMLRVCRASQSDTSYETAPKMTQCVSIPQPLEKKIELPVQIKQEPELILESEELPDSAIIDTETVTDSAEPSAGEFGKMHNIALDPNKCYICNKVFETPEDVRIHFSEHGDMIPYQCSACTIETGQESKIRSLHRLHSHFRLHVSSIKCPKCPHRTFNIGAMRRHIKKHHGQSDQTEYICEQCGKKLLNKVALDGHVHRHKALEEGRYPCSYCDRKLPTNADLVQHERIHADERPYQCYACDKNFHSNGKLSEHILKVHKKIEEVNDGPTLTCKFKGCDFSTMIRSHYYRHKAYHDLRFECPQCSKRFPRRNYLRQHQQVHTGVKVFQCEQCDKSFPTKRALHKHHTTDHNIDHPYSCEIDGRTFVSEQNLKDHLLMHAADRPSFECRHCTMKFKFRGTLAMHEKTHKESAVMLIDPDNDVAEETANQGTQ